MEFLTVSLLNGVIYGLLLFMVSAGLTLIFGMMGVLNFAHASFYMVGAYLAYTLQKYVGFVGAVPLSWSMMPAAMNSEALKVAWLRIWNTAATAASGLLRPSSRVIRPRWLMVE